MDKFTYKAQGAQDDKLKDLRPKQSDHVEAPIAQSKLYNLRREDYAAIFKSPKKAREVWRNIALAVALRPASKPIVQFAKFNVTHMTLSQTMLINSATRMLVLLKLR